MPDRRPVLIVDAGGTLVTRTRPGLASRVVRAVRRSGDATDASDGAVRAAVLTAADPDGCLRALDLRSSAARAAVAAALAEDHGDAVVLPGAEELLRTATELGWRVIVATNAGPGTPPLPAEIVRHVSTVVESREYGLVKEDVRFWHRLSDEQRVDPGAALVVGDSVAADRQAPARAGLQSRLVGGGSVGRDSVGRDSVGRGSAGLATLAGLTAELRAGGPRPADAVAVVAADRERWAGRDIVTAPHLTSLVTRVTRLRVRCVTTATSTAAVVVRRRLMPPAVVMAGDPLPGVCWLLSPSERRSYQTPAELRALLEREGLDLEVLSPSERRHALSMIREARTSGTVAERTADLVLFLRERAKAVAADAPPT